MHPRRDFLRGLELPANGPALTQDLELETLCDAMAAGDRFLFEAAQSTVLASVLDLEVILYRQEALRDCLANPEVARRLYEPRGRGACGPETRVGVAVARLSPAGRA